MQRKKLATKIASILLSAAMLVSTAMTAFATDGEVSVAAEQAEVQTVAETADDEALEVSEEVAAASEEIAEEETVAEGETVAEEEITADEVITEESTTEAAQENVEEAQVLDAEEVVAEENEIALAEDNISTVAGLSYKNVNDYIEYAYGDGNILYFQLTETGKTADASQKSLPNVDSNEKTAWAKDNTIDTTKITTVVIGEGITGIGNFNFYSSKGEYASLITVQLPSTVTKIGEAAFCGASKLTEVCTSPNVGYEVSLHNITSIGAGAFADSGIKSVRFNQDVEIGNYAFQDCLSLKLVVADKNVTFSGYDNFLGCTSLAEFTCKGTMESIPERAFKECSKLNMWRVNGLQKIGYQAFYGCSSLKGITCIDVTWIGQDSLAGSGIESIKFGNKELSLSANAFSGASELTSICYPGTSAQWQTIVKNDGDEVLIPNGATVHCVESSKTDKDPMLAYKAGWKFCDACGYYYLNTDSGSDTDNTDSEHTWGAWKTKSKATVFKAEVQMRTCSDCGETETRTVGKKLTPTITVNAKKIWLQKGQKTSAFKVSGLANGDSVKSYKSGNKKIFTVTNKGVIKAGKKVGKAKLTITLASGMKKVVTVQVQKRQVKTWAIKNLPTKVTVKKGATYTLSPVVSLITSTHKVTYKTSNKKVATVTSAGKIKGVKKGTATITVKSGTITKKVKVTVK